MSSVPAVVVQSLVKRFASRTAVAGATWSAEPGQITTVLGPNGAGKTTTIGCLEGLIRPDAGHVTVLGTDPWRADAEHRARVGVMLQDGGMPNTSRPIPLLRHLASLYARPAGLDDLIEVLGIHDFAGTTVRRLSGGQRQRVALAAALVGAPDVAFLDEPSAGLDPHARLDMWALLRRIRDHGCALVVTTHSFEEAERLADRVVIMADGRTVADGTVEQITRTNHDPAAGGNAHTDLESVYFALTCKDAPRA